MASIHQEIRIDVSAEEVWDALREVGALGVMPPRPLPGAAPRGGSRSGPAKPDPRTQVKRKRRGALSLIERQCPVSSVRFMAARPWSIMVAMAGAMSWGRRSAVHVTRLRPSGSSKT